ncbi:MAG TPA: hypothetical protein VNS53_07610 [Sphingomicrobium sp.]|jgi:hypothetical protein|nr:hypothetical protein [Sphingomicrobium sp.]
MTEKKQLFDKPCEAEAVDGAVEVQGPNDIELALTSEAAEQTASGLEIEALKARGQRRLKDYPHKPQD